MRKKKAGVSPTQRTIKLMKSQGYFTAIVERRIPFKFITIDCYGWIDLLAVHPAKKGIIGIQTTSAQGGGNLSARMKKAVGNPALIAWLLSGNRLVVQGWRKINGRWAVDEREVTMEHLTKEVVYAT